VRLLVVLVLLGALGLAMALSISVGARSIPLDRVWSLVWSPDGSDEATIVRDLRVPRTLLGLLVGAALGLAGALMQSLTRNPLADPGLLGVNAGASLAVVLGVMLFGLTGTNAQVWPAMLGAGAASLLVWGIGGGGGGGSPVRLALAGAAITFALLAAVQAVVLVDRDAFAAYRTWNVGAIAGRDMDVVTAVLPFIAVGIAGTLLLARPLNALALGEDAGRALGAHVGRVRLVSLLLIAVLCGAATAAAGPIVFLGLTVPHVARILVGTDHRWVLPVSALLSPVLLLGADVLGRLLERPGEIEVGIMTAILGGPAFIWLVRRKRLPRL
jgi:iron complex transport system permease protein